jgi:hypothetical protein
MRWCSSNVLPRPHVAPRSAYLLRSVAIKTDLASGMHFLEGCVHQCRSISRYELYLVEGLPGVQWDRSAADAWGDLSL